ncbi:hypothetical protein [Acinetobacter piscicola]|uniref:hypothetical protein n=1 Tax=Acinetobacter piscicola TaxID=2006115 RepID=UPI0010217ED6|nr:hypothetical protein [Acinetobacter piscicola]RYL29253.1 hypothetical protein EWP19_00210 [Acinetobacter piscicola]
MKKLNKKIKLISTSVVISMALSACGGGSSNDGNSAATNPTHPTTPTNPTTPTTPTNIECVNGIPKNLKTTGSGFFSEEIFSLERESNLVFYSNTLHNGVIYQNLTHFLKNSPTSISTDYIDQYRLTPSKLDTSFKQTLTSSGFPLGYVISQNGNSTVLNQFSDECTIQAETQVKSHAIQIDISGKTIADLFKYYDYPNSGNAQRYISSNIVNFLKYHDKKLLNSLLLDQTKFPAGSKIGYIDQTILNAPNITFNDSNLTNYKTIEEFIANTKIPKGYVWKTDQFAGYQVAYPVSSSTGIGYPFTQNYTAVRLNGKIYSAAYFPAGDLIKMQMDPSEKNVDMSETYFNKTAMMTLANALNKVL